MVHGVGRHDPLSSLLQVYQSFRSNILSPEAPIGFEDRIPDWRLDEVNEDAAPPYLRLVPRYPTPEGDIDAVYMYEVNYSTLAGIVRQNHGLDLTRLFVGFDMAVAASRQAQTHPAPTVAVGDTARLAKILQRVSGVMAAATVPILGVPSLLLRNYTETLIATYTRFFEDVATFALDKNGEQLIAAHCDRTVENIVSSPRFTGHDSAHHNDLVIAAHSLGSIVVHNQLVRKWGSADQDRSIPDRLVTFGSPIGSLMWLWLFLDFPSLTFNPDEPTGTNYFCWSPVNNAGRVVKPVSWINVLNCLDPIATAFPTSAVDMSRTTTEVSASLAGGSVTHRFCGNAKISSIGLAHTTYIHDRSGFIEILLRASSLRPARPEDVECTQPPAFWRSTRKTLGRLNVILWFLVVASAAIYCGLVASKFQDRRVMWAVVVFAMPRLTIWLLAFWQRLFFGGPTKRIPDARIAALRWGDFTTVAYRLRRLIGPMFGARREVDPNQPGRPMAALLHKGLSFLPTIAAMTIPVAVGAVLRGRLPHVLISTGWYAAGVIAFTVYLILCAACELIASWRAALKELDLGRV
jgi:hypothetical protein